MGLTPLEGVPMGTRSGSIDPAIVEFIANKENKTRSTRLNGAEIEQSEAIVKRIDAILTEAGFEWYTANETPRYKDNDIGLLMNVRKYRFFDWGN